MLNRHVETKLALGGDTTIVLVTKPHVDTLAIFSTLWREIFQFERQFSRFLPASELTRFNQQAGLEVAISPEFHDLLSAAVALSKQTDGLYNPFILPALQRTGYVHSAVAQYANDPVEDYRHRSVVTPDKLQLGADKASIPYGTAIDMGGCGKGYLADRLAHTLNQFEVEGFWISLSGDMITAGTDEHGKPWVVTIQSAESGKELADVCIEAAGKPLAIATSGTLKRPGHSKVKGHHIIDPRTGTSAETDIVLATVVARSALQADVLASCAVILGSKVTEDFLQAQGVFAAYIQTPATTLQFGTLLRPVEEVSHVA